MSTSLPARRTVSTGGAWLGFGIAARSGLVVVFNACVIAVVVLIPVFVEAAQRESRSGEAPPELRTMLDLVSEFSVILTPYALVTGISAIALGAMLIATSFGLLQGSDFARKATRALLVLDALHSVGSTVWITVISLTRLGDWMERYLKANEELMALMAKDSPAPPHLDLRGMTAMNAASSVVTLLVSLGLTGVLIWLAGRPFARDWCASRSGRSPVASQPGPG